MIKPNSSPVVLSKFWEVAFGSGGDVFLVHPERRHYRIRRPHPAIVRLLQGLSVSEPSDRLLGQLSLEYSPAVTRLIQEAIGRLQAAGVLVTPVENHITGMTEQVCNRFSSLVDWVESFDHGDGGTALNRMRQGRVAMIGLGGAGSLCAAMLAASGIGHLTLIDGDHVEETNLVRQLFYTEADAVGRELKVNALRRVLNALSSLTTVTPIPEFVKDQGGCAAWIRGHDFVVLTGDVPRILLQRVVNCACVHEGIPLLYAFHAQIGPMFMPGVSPCFACLEEAWRAESGAEYDELVAAFQDKPQRTYPSIVSGPVDTARLIFSDVFGAITRAYVPATLDAMITTSAHASSVVPVRRNLRCPVCHSRAAVRS